jgi:riboflavin-specific deaminase-like protein
MQAVEVTKKVWQRLLEIRKGAACACCGDWTAQEKAALDLYAPIARRDLGPAAIGQIGQSLDGRVATVSGDAAEISGPDGFAHLHRLRALCDAVVIGARTAIHDNPRLTVRLCPGPNPVRVVIDPRGRLEDDTPVFREDGVRRIVVQGVDRKRPRGVEILRVSPCGNGRLQPQEILSRLNEEGLATVLIEGGAITIANFLEAGLLHRLQISVAPLLIGAGPQGFRSSQPIHRLADALRPATRVFNIGSDILFDCTFAPEAAEPAPAPHSRQQLSEVPGIH